jgi:hypothetical protein
LNLLLGLPDFFLTRLRVQNSSHYHVRRACHSKCSLNISFAWLARSKKILDTKVSFLPATMSANAYKLAKFAFGADRLEGQEDAEAS